MLRFKLFHVGNPVPLSESLPMLEHMGLKVLDEHPHRIAPEGMPPIAMHDFGLQTSLPEVELDIGALHQVFEDAFAQIFRGEVENDDFNRLVVAARMQARDVVVLRAYGKYLRQIGFALSQAFIEATLAAHAGVARMLVELFYARFDPEVGAGAGAKAAEKEREIAAALEQVENLSEDRVLRQYLALVLATTRTNFWRRDADGRPRGYLSFKFDPAKVPGLPEPKPMFEIFVYSTRFEGVHLRGGRVARGGLRWSDRPEDFRTEVLGLVKAQMVKNTVIVPVGSKGGFVLKRAPAMSDRDAYMKEGVACYKDYLRGLLDLTDNRAGDRIVPPPQVKRHDPDDPYLVVAADKGTATFSDYANGISAEYGFWLGDAFASGGSVGYDHKAMGITARGAWESVKRHFREMGVDTQATEFTVAGIGDMSGDVFGNGMLLSRHIRLVAAFDHRHIFLDPSPDAAAGYGERARMFRLPRSTWADYDTKLISAGGGVHPRSAKSIALTPEVKAVLAITVDVLTPTELVNAILKAPVDLIYNGGIGTYVKATAETHAQVGDRANDALRVNGSELRCKVFAEGGNLGCTQLGRIEYAMAGGRIFTDAIDNSAGVDTSDHEVNIKILLSLPIAEGELTEKQRNTLLAEMTDDVAALVLRDNYFQTQVLSVTGRIAPALLDAQTRFMQFLEKAGRLNRAIEFLPPDDEIAKRRAAGRGLASPEAAVLLAYSKIWLYDELLASSLPDDPWVATALLRYFPGKLQQKYAAAMARHPLKREIIATHVVNSMLNRVGSTFVHRLAETTGAKAHEIVRAYLLSREIFGLVPLWLGVEALDNKVDDAVQAAMLIDSSRLLERGTDVVPALAAAPGRDGRDDRALPAGRGGFVREPAHAARCRRTGAHGGGGGASRRGASAGGGRAAGRHVRHAVRDARRRRGRGQREEAGGAGGRDLLRCRHAPRLAVVARKDRRVAGGPALAAPGEERDAGRPVGTAAHGRGRRARRRGHRLDLRPDRRVGGSQPPCARTDRAGAHGIAQRGSARLGDALGGAAGTAQSRLTARGRRRAGEEWKKAGRTRLFSRCENVD